MDPFGPTGGKLVRPSDGKEAKNVAFIQCAGSRDINHLKHCSRICCMASLKQSTYVSEKFGDAADVTIYYIDIRAIDRFDDFYQRVQDDENVKFIKSKVANIVENKENRASSLMIGMSMVPRGEVGLIFAEIGRCSGIFDYKVHAGMVIVIVLTTVIPPFTIKWLHRHYSHKLSIPEKIARKVVFFLSTRGLYRGPKPANSSCQLV